MTHRPNPTEAASYYFTYIDKVPDGDIASTLERQRVEFRPLLDAISEERSLHRYAPDKWSIRQVLSHISDTERAFTFRALWFARGFQAPLPGFDQNIGVTGAGADSIVWTAHVEEFFSVRSATISLFRNLPPEAWTRTGTADGKSFTVNALAWITAGHALHHAAILRERYL